MKFLGQPIHVRRPIVDQIRRSSASVVLNIAEGAGEHAIAEKARFYRMAKRSATECASSVEICLHLRLVEESQYAKVREYVIRIAAMLTKLIQSKAGQSVPVVPVSAPLPMPRADPVFTVTKKPDIPIFQPTSHLPKEQIE